MGILPAQFTGRALSATPTKKSWIFFNLEVPMAYNPPNKHGESMYPDADLISYNAGLITPRTPQSLNRVINAKVQRHVLDNF
ncbi:hypothetical protein SAMD00079811_38750 [Scytonema sp. HK-05]|nr:hypothetical protein SAMD00079811_38750 [Scytonema sp. HK-05]